MTIGSTMLALVPVAGVFGAVLYWIFVVPVRERRRRRAAGTTQGAYSRAWDSSLDAKRRER